MAKQKTTLDNFTATIAIGGKKYTGTGKSVSEALSSLEVRNPKGKAVLSVTHGTETKDRVLPAPQVSRLLSGHGLMKEVALKHVSSLFSGL